MAKAIGAGSVLEIGSTNDPATATWTPLKFVRNFRMNGSANEIEVTSLESTAKEFIRDLADYGRASMEVYYDPAEATHGDVTGLEKLFATGEERAFRFRPNGATKRQTFRGFVMTREQAFDPAQPMNLSAEIRITGPITYVAVT